VTVGESGAKHRGSGARQKREKLEGLEEEIDQKMEEAKKLSEKVIGEKAQAPLASIREVELEMKKLAQKEYRRALLRKEVDVTRVAWKPRPLLDWEVDRSDATAVAMAKFGEKRARLESEVGAKLTGEDAIIWIELFHPVKQGYLLQDILVLGSTPLVSFKDIIYCLRDVQAEREGHALTKNGFLFIEGVFYNDLRSPNAVDYSEPMLDYQRKDALTAPGAPVEMNIVGKGFTAADMRGVRFCDVPLTIGRPYVMTHQGKCEHKWRVRDVRAPHADDDTDKRLYPLVIREGRVFRRGCSVCGVFDSTHVTYADRMAAESPSFYCKLCFDAVHCDVHGNKLYNDFEEYTYDHE
jgi:snRNA-activating protein complex subunit 3